MLFFSDPHNADLPPRMRTSSYCEDILVKQEALIEPAKKCDFVICGGDVFHSKQTKHISYKLTNRLMEIYREFPRLYICPGNHDVEDRWDWSDRPLGTLEKVPKVYVKHKEIVSIGGVNLWFFGGGEFFNFDNLEDFVNRNVSEHRGLDVGVFHASIADKNYPFVTRTCSEILQHSIDFLLLGHLHDFQMNTKSVCAPGGLSRGILKLDESLERKVFYAIIEVEEGEVVNNMLYELPVKSIEEAFKLEEKISQENREEAINSFVEYIEGLKLPSGVTKEQLIEEIKKMDIEEGIKNNAVRILELV